VTMKANPQFRSGNPQHPKPKTHHPILHPPRGQPC
jgi:hypothetical protein